MAKASQPKKPSKKPAAPRKKAAAKAITPNDLGTGPGGLMCVNCKFATKRGDVIKVMSRQDCLNQGGVPQGDDFPCPPMSPVKKKKMK